MIGYATATAPVSATNSAVQRFAKVAAALETIDAYASSLHSEAAERRMRGLAVCDQSCRELAFCLAPRVVVHRPLVLIGGMGPLAGAAAFRLACERFGESRVSLLYQACSVPDRTPAILADAGTRSSLAYVQMGQCLAAAIKRALSLLPTWYPRLDCIIACNSAHYFWNSTSTALAESRDVARKLNLISTAGCAVRALHTRPPGRVLILCTEGARRGRVFSRPLQEAGIAFEEPRQGLERLLMRAIYDGVKSLNRPQAAEAGNRFFEGVLQTSGQFRYILAGCTELPPLFDLLRQVGSPEVAAFLSETTIVNPLEAALDAAA